MNEITKPNDYKPTNAEIKILEVLSDPANLRKSITEKCEIAGISRTAWYESFKKPEFVSLIPNTAIDLIRARAVELVNASFNAALSGSFNDRKMLLESAKIVQPPQQQINVDNRSITIGWLPEGLESKDALSDPLPPSTPPA